MPNDFHELQSEAEPDDDIRPRKAARERLDARRKAALARADISESGILIGKEWRDFTDPKAREHYQQLDYRTGLAFSGGGIRSATISLGVAEALASRGWLYSFDMLSTVSGGGYFGSFLRALHLKRSDYDKKWVRDQAGLAEATMSSHPDQQYFRGKPGHSPFVTDGKTIKNPLWWLRENGRYLAPQGSADYLFALTYIIRGWVSLFLFALGTTLLVFAAVQAAMVGIASLEPAVATEIMAKLSAYHLYSPLWLLLALMTCIGVGTAGSYWLTTPLSYAGDFNDQSIGQGKAKVTMLATFLLSILAALIAANLAGHIPSDATARGWAVGLIIAITAALVTMAIAARLTRGKSHVELRIEITRMSARFAKTWLVLAAFVLVDWAALATRLYLDGDMATDEGKGILGTGVISGLIASLFSFLIAKMPDWFGTENSVLGRFLVAHARKFALVAAVIIMFAIALLADVLAIKLLWRGAAWTVGSALEWKIFLPVVTVVGAIAMMCASSRSFANLTALTPFYGSRLTRSFIGGGNPRRLDAERQRELTQRVPGDDLPLQEYMEGDCAAPLHLVNATRNRTEGEQLAHMKIDVANDDPLVLEDTRDPRGRLASFESSLTLHDRHGDRMVFGPFGLRVGAKFFNWDEIKDPPSLGMLAAISGAAVGSGMGRLTSLGTSMAFTLANIRLGYWWKALEKTGDAPRQGPFLARKFPGLDCLSRELIGKFGTKDHWFLSDGGHSENTGVLTLLERGCRFIVACDNGQDKALDFGDLEILIRSARTDIGVEVSVARHNRFPKSLRPIRDFFFNGSEGDWRAHARKTDNEAFALLLRAADIPHKVNGVWKRRRRGNSWIVWIKPCLFAGLPVDVSTYARLNPDFPQQSTGNQFFDEAQWESYRQLGFEMGRRLFRQRKCLEPFLPLIVMPTHHRNEDS